MQKFRGSYVVCITPMDKEQNIDLNGLKENIDWYISEGASGICCCGSTGEFVSLSKEERHQVAQTTVEYTNARVPVLVGTSAETTNEMLDYTRHAKDIGADGALIINPYYCKPAENEIYEFFKAVSENVDIPVMAYNNPHTSGIDMSNELIVEICKLKNIDYVKESSGEIRRIRELLNLSDDEINIFCGSDDLAFESFVSGAVGFISVCGNVIPGMSQKLFDLVQQGDLKGAKELYKTMLPLLDLIEGSGKLVQVVKAAVNKIGHAAGPCRLPRLPLTAEEDAALEKVLKGMSLL